MSKVSIWHNPRCSKSREALALLRDRGVTPEIRLYLDQPPTSTELREAQSRLGLPAIAMMRRREKRFQELGLSGDTPEDALIAAMAENPILIERPIVFAGGEAVIGRPTERILEIL